MKAKIKESFIKKIDDKMVELNNEDDFDQKITEKEVANPKFKDLPENLPSKQNLLKKEKNLLLSQNSLKNVYDALNYRKDASPGDHDFID